MRRLGCADHETGPHRHQAEPLTGECDHCSWHTVQESYPAIVKAYQDHLREHHHDAWVRT
jgi:hypothetical protein